MRRTLFLLSFLAFLALAPSAGHAGTFEMTASVDRDHLELGESLHLSINVGMNGQMTFGPQLEQPNFDGFAPQGGPSQSQQVQWVNGAVSMTQTFTWELVAQKAGVLTLGPFRASGKDALAGSLLKTAPAIRITVARPKNFKFNLPGQQAGPTAAPPEGESDEVDLRDIKADRPLPWALIGLAAAGVLALGALLFWWWYKPRVVTVEAVPRDPAQLALEQLEKAYQALQPGGEAEFIKVAEGLLRQFLRHKLRLRQGVTLTEALRAVRFQAPGAMKSAREELAERLTWLLYSGITPQPADADQVYAQLRAQVIELERIIVPPAPEPTAVGPAALALARNPGASAQAPAAAEQDPADLAELRARLDKAVARWHAGHPDAAWKMMRQALQGLLNEHAGERDARQLQAWVLEALRGLGAEDLVSAADLAFSAETPEQAPEALAEGLMALAQALLKAPAAAGKAPKRAAKKR